MEFKREIQVLENTINREGSYLKSLGTTQVLLTALETTDKTTPDGTTIFAEEFQKAITRYVASYTDSSYFIKLRDTENDNLEELTNFIETNCINLVFDITGVSDLQDNDIIIRPLNNVDSTILKELEEAFTEEGITKVLVTEKPQSQNNIDLIKIEISRDCRNIEEPEKLEKVCNALIKFIEMYSNYLY